MKFLRQGFQQLEPQQDRQTDTRAGKYCYFAFVVVINFHVIVSRWRDAVALLVRHRTCDLQVAGSSPGWAPLRGGLGQATYTCVPLSPSRKIGTGQGG